MQKYDKQRTDFHEILYIAFLLKLFHNFQIG
jgi:hypothetical protein